MPAFTLYGARGSTNTDRVRLTLAEGGITDYDLVLLNLQKGEQKSPTHLAHHHPFGKVPALTTPSGFTLYESRAICKYLAATYSLPLLPSSSSSSPESLALFDQAQSVETAYFAEPAGRLSFEKVAKKFMGLKADEAVVQKAVGELERFFDVAEGWFGTGGQEWMVGGVGDGGGGFSLVDIYYIPLVQRLFACGYGEVVMGREGVRGWWERCVSRPGIRGVLDADREAASAAAAAAAAATAATAATGA